MPNCFPYDCGGDAFGPDRMQTKEIIDQPIKAALFVYTGTPKDKSGFFKLLQSGDIASMRFLFAFFGLNE